MGKHSPKGINDNMENEVNGTVQEPETAPAAEQTVEAPAAEQTEEVKTEETPSAPQPLPEGAEENEEKRGSDEPRDKKHAPRKRPNRRRRRGGMPAQVVIFLLFVTLLFGLVLGFMLGRSSVQGKVAQRDERITELEDMVVEAGGSGEELDVFTDEMTEENQIALNDLSGEISENEPVDEGTLALQGEDGAQYEEVDADDTEDANVIVAEYKDGTVTAAEARTAYSDELNRYILEGGDEEEIGGDLMDEVLTGIVKDRVLTEHAKELGVYELTKADDAAIEAAAKAEFENNQDFASLLEDDSDTSEEDEDGDAPDYDAILADTKVNWWKTKLYNKITEGVTADDARVQAVYSELLNTQKENFEAYPDEYEFAVLSGETVVYVPSGCMSVTVITITDAEKAEEAKAALKSGASFDMLAKDYGSETYVLGPGSMQLNEDVMTAVSALTNVGDCTQPIETEDGLVIARYNGAAQSGEIPLSKVRDAILKTAEESAAQIAYDDQVAQWMAEADPKYYPERMQ